MCFDWLVMLIFPGYFASLQLFQRIAVLHTHVLETQQNVFVTALVFSYHCKKYFPFGESVQNLLSDIKMKALLKRTLKREILQNLLPKTAKHCYHLQISLLEQKYQLIYTPYPTTNSHVC